MGSCTAYCRGILLDSLLEKKFLYCAEVVRFKVRVIQNSCCSFLGSLELFRMNIAEKAVFPVFLYKLSLYALRHFPQF